MFDGAYKGLKVFLTGHTGFKGSWLSVWLKMLGAEVLGYSDCVPTSPSHFESLQTNRYMNSVYGDVRDRRALKKAVDDFQPDIIFHLAAQALVRVSYERPAETIEINTIGTLNILEIARSVSSVKAVVCITSDKAYRNDEWVWGYRETDPLGGYDPYSASKGCAEIVARSYFESFFNDAGAACCATTRAGNVIGGGDWALDRIVPDCARAWSQGESVSIRSPLATRPWQHVLEPLSGYLWLGAKLLQQYANETVVSDGVAGQAFNFGPSADVCQTVKEVVLGLDEFWDNFDYKLSAEESNKLKECSLLKLCCDKALAYLGWKATMTFDETMFFTADWYRKYYQNPEKSCWALTCSQIEQYCNIAQDRNLEWCGGGDE